MKSQHLTAVPRYSLESHNADLDIRNCGVMLISFPKLLGRVPYHGIWKNCEYDKD